MRQRDIAKLHPRKYSTEKSDIPAIWHGDTMVIQAPSSGAAPGSHWDLDGSRVPINFLAAARL